MFNAGPSVIAHGENASYVLGQSSFTTSASAITQSGFNGPSKQTYDPGNGRLFVSDAGNDRIMVFQVDYCGGSPSSWHPGCD
jgi:DNA-binding beta-propeller fold protein YncE